MPLIWGARLLRDGKRRQYILRQRLKAWLRRHGVPGCAGPEAAAFEAYQRARSQLCSGDLSRLSLPVEPGLVSVVLPVYNGARYVREAIESVLAQTYFSYELIVVDDGSTDGSGRIASEYARDPRVRIITQANEKLPRALSNGFRTARGEYLTWISADNRFKPAFLESMVRCLARHPAVEMIYANQDIIGDDGRPLRGSEWFWPYQRPLGSEHIHWPADTGELNVIANNYLGAAFLYRYRAYFLLGDYSPDLFGLEDYDYWMRMNALLRVRHADFDEPVYDYRLHAESLTSREAELGIPQNAQSLIALDARRREMYLGPISWHVEAESSGARCRELAERIRQATDAIRPRSHMPGGPDPDAVGGAGPAVYVRIVPEHGIKGLAGPDRRAGTLGVLVVATDGPLPEDVSPGWDLCAAWSERAQPRRLAGDRRGWLVTGDLSALVTAIDIRARSEHRGNPATATVQVSGASRHIG